MTCDEALKTQAYLDGELDAARSLEVEAHLEHCAQCQTLAMDHADLKSAMAGATYHRAPAALRAKISDALDAETKVVPLKPRNKRSFWLGAGSGAGGMAIAAALAFLLLAPANSVVADLGD